MKKEMKWGLATLMLLLGIAAVFIFLDQNAELQQLEKETAESDKLRQERNKPQETPVAVEELPPVVHPNEHPSGPHQHEDDTAHNPSVSQVSQTYTGPLTYHAELLETNPVKALRLQAEERGHWSAQWIPPFPPDDQEAATVARSKYLMAYYKSIGDMDNPVYKKAYQDYELFSSTIFDRYPNVLEPFLDESGRLDKTLDLATQQELIERWYRINTRRNDLLQLSWVNLSPEDVGDLSIYGNPSDPAAPPITDDR